MLKGLRNKKEKKDRIIKIITWALAIWDVVMIIMLRVNMPA